MSNYLKQNFLYIIKFGNRNLYNTINSLIAKVQLQIRTL